MDRHGIIWRDDALDSGISDVQIAKAINDNRIEVVARGAYAPTSDLPADPGEAFRERYRRRSLAAAAGLARTGDEVRAVSHQSAAALLGLGLLMPNRRAVHITTGRNSGGNAFPSRVIHASRLADDDVVDLGGLRVTGPARTAVDIALTETDFARILAVFDSALRMGVSREELESRLSGPRRGVARARYVLAFADGLSDNPGESWGRAQMIEAEFPIPILQAVHHLEDGHRAICDYDWEGRVVGEFDGHGKYLREELRSGEDVADVVLREKERENQLRDLDLGVVRWGWERLKQRTLIPYLSKRLPIFGIALPSA
ncbi:type IV toxin-antitoxin system AbiEi family antitoxin [Gordonia neofelifaecis]|uniref:AbiEi antitoxin C-terminal domain-containing protein n=1 Tax=Gordonia neofelifaecis NRRL B-59395 TaxID=644548 RepID=F1YP08_9ACTN|nr:type IV toxin-antitoxin system AbiEi family antitoxin [Gordonia neofelifaecis]EGD53627.1 hypothetical protein SCNU_18287 [Gordonia neofelifaecis NRRL B-59395]